MAQSSGGKMAFGIFALAALLGTIGWLFFAAPAPRSAPSPSNPGGPPAAPSMARGTSASSGAT